MPVRILRRTSTARIRVAYRCDADAKGHTLQVDVAQAVDDVLTELGQFMADELAATAMALGGLRIFAAQVVAAIPPETAEGQTYLVGADMPDIGWILRINDAVAAGSLAGEVAGAGVMVQRITQQLIVRLYAG